MEKNSTSQHKSDWVVVVDEQDAMHLRELYQNREVVAARNEGRIWLKFTAERDEANFLCRSIPRIGLYRRMKDHQLVRAGHQVPEARLPDLPWEPLHRMIHLRLPKSTHWPSKPEPVSLELVRADSSRPINLLRCRLQDFNSWVASAAERRFASLTYASSGMDALVQGSPLPPIAGDLFHEKYGIAVLAGFRFGPAASHQTVRTAMQKTDGGTHDSSTKEWDDLVLFYPDRDPLRCFPIDFVNVRRSSLIRTIRKLVDCG